MGDSTAMTRTEPTNGNALEQIRQQGANAIAQRRLLNEMYKLLEGCEWGTGTSVIKGENFSPATRAAFAKFCVITRANPQIHVDILGGKPYLNANYWFERVNADPYFISSDQRSISLRTIQQLRNQARQAIADAEEFEMPEMRSEAAKLLTEARDLERLRAEYGVPEWALEAYETTIFRYIDSAPLDLIAAGEIKGADLKPFIREVKACNWAGNKPKAKTRDGREYDADPVGNAEPAKTAQTRSFRRCAVRAFPAWGENFDKEISQAEEIIEAEWVEIKADRAAAAAQLPSSTDSQAVSTGAGEPSAAVATDAKALPVEDITGTPRSNGEPERAGLPNQRSGDDGQASPAGRSPTAEWTGIEYDNARGSYFGALRDAGIGDRKAWQAENGLPASWNNFTRADYQRAMQLLMGLMRTQLLNGIGVLGFESIEEYVRARDLAAPESIKDLKILIARVNREIEDGAQ